MWLESKCPVRPRAVRYSDGKVDVCEDQHNVTLKMEVPGIDDKDRKGVRIENNIRPTHPFENKVPPEGRF